MFWKTVGFLACLCLLTMVGPTTAQPAAVAAKLPIGVAIASKTPSLNWYEKRDGQLVCAGTLNVLDVTPLEEEGDYYRVRRSGRQGWVKREDVVTRSQGIAYFKGCVERDPLDGYAQCMYAYELMYAKQPAQAQIAADEAVRLLPNDSRPRQVRLSLCFLNGNEKAALDDSNIAVRLDPSNGEVYVMRASVIAMFQKKYDEVFLDLDKASRLSPKDEAIYIMRARIWQLKGEYRKAVADYDLAIRADPECLDAQVERADLLSFIDPAVYNLPEAIISARRACELTKWENGTHLRRLARLYDRAGNKEEALRWREKAEHAGTAQLPPLPAAKP